MRKGADLPLARLRLFEPIRGKALRFGTDCFNPNAFAAVFEIKVGSIADAGEHVSLVMQVLRERKSPRALRQAGRLAVRKFRDEIVRKTKPGVGLPKPCQFDERGRPVLEMLREETADTRVEAGKLCRRDHCQPAPPSSFVPRATIRKLPSGNGRCRGSASLTVPVIQVSISSGVVRIAA